jgi:hypothetical protein
MPDHQKTETLANQHTRELCVWDKMFAMKKKKRLLKMHYNQRPDLVFLEGTPASLVGSKVSVQTMMRSPFLRPNSPCGQYQVA